MKLVEEFWAESESGGKYLLSVYAKMVDQRNKDYPTAPPREGLKYVKTREGLHCNRIDDNTFQVVETGDVVRRLH